MLLAIDPGNEMSGWVLLDGYTPVEFGKDYNEVVLDRVDSAGLFPKHDPDVLVVVMVASYGMAVGQTVFDTCVWIGRFCERFNNGPDEFLYRKDVKMNLCGNNAAKDSNIRQALVDRFSYDRHKAKGGKGTVKDPGFFYGFKADIWQAYGLGVSYLDLQSKNGTL